MIWNGYVPARHAIWIQNMDEVAIHTPKLEVLKYCTHLAGLLHVCFQGGGRHSCQGLKHDSNQPVSGWFRVRCYIILTLRSNRLIVTCLTTGINHQSVDYCITPNFQPLFLLTIPSLIQSWRDKSMFWLVIYLIIYIYIPFSNKSWFLEKCGFVIPDFNKPPPSHTQPLPIWPSLPQLELRAPGEELAPFALSEAFASGSSVGLWLVGFFWDPYHISWLCLVDGSGIRLKKTVKQRSLFCIYKYTGDKASKLTKLS